MSLSIRSATLRLSGLAACVLSWSAISWGAQAKDGPVYIDRSQVDEDYHFQGEYRGFQNPLQTVRSTEPVALQVIALGEGKFEAVKYYGGLPGSGWKGKQRYLLQGVRVGDRVELLGDQFDIVVDGKSGAIYTHRGQPAGELRKVERVSPTMGAQPPEGAIVLFDGTSTEHFVNGKTTPEGYLREGTETKGAWNDFRLHGEFLLPYKPLARGQNRGNSGFYLQGRYEVQVLDSFGLEGVENECGALYKTKRPDLNMCLPPLQWQTYDIEFHAPKFDDAGNKIRNMEITVWHNGVLIHNRASIPNKTGAGKSEAPHPLPIKLQDHANPVLYRNLWLIDLSEPGTERLALPDPPRKVAPLPVQVYPPYPYPQPLPVSIQDGRLLIGAFGG